MWECGLKYRCGYITYIISQKMKKKRGFEKMIEKRPDSPIGIIIKARLKEMEHSQPWLARQVDRSAGTINFIIKGRITPSAEL